VQRCSQLCADADDDASLRYSDDQEKKSRRPPGGHALCERSDDGAKSGYRFDFENQNKAAPAHWNAACGKSESIARPVSELLSPWLNYRHPLL
jgi:hypothetical protein